MIDPTHFCAGCNRVRCTCPPPWWEETQAEEAYCRGHADGQELGPENRPSKAWLRHWLNPRPEPCPEDYLRGYDDGAAGLPNQVEAHYERLDRQRKKEHREASQMSASSAIDDGLPF